MKVTSDVGPWAIVPEWVLDTDVSDRAIRLYALLGRYADGNGSSFANRRKLAERLRCSVKSLDRAMAELEAAGALISTERRRTDGSQTSDLRTLVMASPVTRGGDTSVPPPRDTGVPPMNESQLERETSLAAAPRKKPRQRNEVWDALTDLFGEATTRTSQTLRGKVTKSLADATYDEIHARAKRWHRVFPNAVLTETALDKHWPLLEPASRRAPPPSEPPEPQPKPTAAERAANVKAAKDGLQALRRNL